MGPVFPPEWEMSERISVEFCDITRKSLERLMFKRKLEIDTKLLLHAIQRTSNFESLLSRRFTGITLEQVIKHLISIDFNLWNVVFFTTKYLDTKVVAAWFSLQLTITIWTKSNFNYFSSTSSRFTKPNMSTQRIRSTSRSLTTKTIRSSKTPKHRNWERRKRRTSIWSRIWHRSVGSSVSASNPIWTFTSKRKTRICQNL